MAYSLSVALYHLRRWREARAAAERALALSPGHTNARFTLALCYIAENRPQDAQPEIRRILDLEPYRTDALAMAGTACHRMKDFAASERYYLRALAIDPEMWAARSGLGAAYYGHGRPAEAEEQFREAIRLSPQSDRDYYGLGVAQMRQGRYTEALRSLRTALRLNPRYVEAYIAISHARRRQAKLGEASWREAILATIDAVRAIRFIWGP